MCFKAKIAVYCEHADPLGLFYIFLVLWTKYMNRVAILIDGGFFLKRLPRVRQDVDSSDARSIHKAIKQLVRSHLEKLNEIQETKLRRNAKPKDPPEFILEPNWFTQLYRCFYYDAAPFDGKGHKPKSKIAINYAKSDEALLRKSLFNLLKRERNFALRLGHCAVDKDCMWAIKPKNLKELLSDKRKFEDLTDEDFQTSIRQKGVDIRLGLDMASIASKQQANIFVLVTGDADFVPAAKLVRREGCTVILDPLHFKISDDLFEHIDAVTSGFSKPRGRLPRQNQYP